MKKTIFKKCIYALYNPKVIRNAIMVRFPSYFDDELYLRETYRGIFGKDMHLSNPQTFNEKLNWLKLNDRNPLYTVLADKYWVKRYVANLIGEEYVVPCYGHWKQFSEIDFESLPDKCFMKMNHDSQKGVLIDKKAGLDIASLKIMFSDRRVHRNWYWPAREWVYKNIEPCIMAEMYLDVGKNRVLQDYKFWCFNGKPTYMYITNKGTRIMENFYDMQFNPVDINHGFPRRQPEFDCPQNFELMKQLAAKLSAHIPFVRVDFYDIRGKVFFGEYTFYDWGGMAPFADENTDLELGKLIELPHC